MKLEKLFRLFNEMSKEEQYTFISDYRIQREIEIKTSLENKTKKKKLTKTEKNIANLNPEEKESLDQLLLICPDLKNFI